MPWGIIAIPALACLAYGFLLGLKSHEVIREKMDVEKNSDDAQNIRN
ncbi:hypothetical protein QQ008_02475 [Fulvivirgaceae bacterium BMA10]|uniref:Photosystem I reaction center subunit VIII n=1 Tax=Splendidivirga corallicola TaxID=3051826 RepID=A0ABT8KHL4_9BACT|nr:hypothetical protein [Fulvivirgaceae bacterium BMA10]